MAHTVDAPPQTPVEPSSDTYRVIILDSSAAKVRVLVGSDRYRLPSVDIPRCQRIAENLTDALKNEWGEGVICLFTLDNFASNNGTRVSYQVTERWACNGNPRLPMRWEPVSDMVRDSFADYCDHSAIMQAVARSKGERLEPTGPFARLGWFGNLREWVETVIEPRGLYVSSKFRQLNAGPSFSLVRFETDGPAVWFKAVGAPNQQEFAIACILAELFPSYLPPILGTRPDWNGWLAQEAAGTNLGETQELRLWEKTASSLASLQINSIDHRLRLLAAGARDQRVNALSNLVQPFIEAMVHLMELQTRVPPAILGGKELLRLGDCIQAALDSIQSLGIPDTLGHSDLNPWNIVVSPRSCAFLDWAEAHVGYPFFSFQYFLEHFRRTQCVTSAAETKLRESYCEPWTREIPPSALIPALRLSPLLAAFACATGSSAWADEKRRQEPPTARYLRSLTRRMHREANQLRETRSQLLSPVPHVRENTILADTLGAPPLTRVEPVTEVLHNIEITDPYRWLENQDSGRTREWIEEQAAYTRAYFASIPDRQRIRRRVEDLLAPKDVLSDPWNVGDHYFFLKRQAGSDRPVIVMRDGLFGRETVLVDPAQREGGNSIAVSIAAISADRRFLAYSVRQGGTDHSSLEILDTELGIVLPDHLPESFCTGIAFAPDGTGFHYSYRELQGRNPNYRAALWHRFGTDRSEDRETFSTGDKSNVVLWILDSPEARLLAYAVCFTGKTPRTSVYLQEMSSAPITAELVLREIEGCFVPFFARGQLLAYTDFTAPNVRIVRIDSNRPDPSHWHDLVPESDSRIQQFAVAGDQVFIALADRFSTRIESFGLDGRRTERNPIHSHATIDLLNRTTTSEKLFYSYSSISSPTALYCYDTRSGNISACNEGTVPVDPSAIAVEETTYTSEDGTAVPLFLAARRDLLHSGPLPTFLTGYGGFGNCVTPRFTAFATFLMEQGFLLAIPALRGGSELGEDWHRAGKRENRQNTFNDFVAAAEWLAREQRAISGRIAIGGGSNAGLLVGAAITQRPELFRAAVCLGPLLDMVRYHLFNFAAGWADEYGSPEDRDDFLFLLAYSPYHHVQDRVAYPAVLLISGDADTRCNPMHARKMAARLQAATSSTRPILLDYKPEWGHTPVQPLSTRIEGLTDRLAFVCHELGVHVDPWGSL